MHRTGSLTSSFLIGLSGLAALSALTAGTASAGTATTSTAAAVPLNDVLQVVASSQYVFYSEGAGSYSLISGTPTTGVVVTDLAGNYVTTLDSGDGVEGIALSPDGTTLYAALSAKSSVAAITLSTITSGTPTQVLYPLAGTDVPYDVAVQSGKVWVSYQPELGVAGLGTIGDINLAAADPTTAFEPGTAAAGVSFYDAPALAADPADDGVIIAAQESISDSPAAAFSTTTDPATATGTGSINGFSGCGFQSGIAVIAGGTKFIAGCGSADVFSTSGGASAFSHPLSSYPISPSTMATNAAGVVALGSGSTLDVYLPSGARANQITVSPGISGLAFSPDGKTLYAVVQQASNTYSLQVIYQPALPQPTLTLSIPATSPITQSITLGGKLTLPGGKLPPAGTPLTITRAGVSTASFTAKTAANGTFAVADHSAGSALGTYTYTVSYAGSATVAPATATHTLTVVKFSPGLTLNLGATTVNYGTTTVVTAHLAKAYTNHAILIYAQLAGHAKQLIGHGNVNSAGNFAVRYRSPYNVTYSAAYAGDARVNAATVSHGVRVRAEVLESISGYNGTSGSYRLYTGSETLTAHVSVAPNKHGQCGRLELDQYYQGAWVQIGLSPCFGLSSASTLVVGVQLSGLANTSGIKFRIRGDYVASSTEKLNLGNGSGWQYFMVS
jgi:hypothetical protein